MKVIAVVLWYDFKLDTIAPTREDAMEYVKKRIERELQQVSFADDLRVILVSDAIVLKTRWEYDAYHFLECDVDNMYDNPTDITGELIPIFREWLMSQCNYSYYDIDEMYRGETNETV